MRDANRLRPARWRYEAQLFWLTLLSGFPALVVALILMWRADFTWSNQISLASLLTLFWVGTAAAVRARVVRPLRTLSNILSAFREGDFSIRARGGQRTDALGEVVTEVNILSEMLREQRLGAREATALLHTVMKEIGVAVYAFDADGRLRLANRAGERLLACTQEQLLGHTAAELGLADCLEGDPARTLEKSFSGRLGRWGMRRTAFRQGGLPHQLVVLSDLSQALREEERQAWQRLLRVLGHEFNNSLAPIKSISGSLATILARDPPPSDWREDLRRGLGVIGGRAEALSRFTAAYSRLARLPQPRLLPVELTPLITRVAGLETRLKIEVEPGPLAKLLADADQLEQLLINLLRNAADAALEPREPARPARPEIRIRWAIQNGQLQLAIADNGPGLSDTGNLFVPFFTTKPGGSGIGLVLSRQIAEAHGGSLRLENRPGSPGCVAHLQLPLAETTGR